MRVEWSTPLAEGADWRLERRAGAGPWQNVAGLSAGSVGHPDVVMEGREALAYRVVRGAGGRGGRSPEARVVPVFTGRPLHGWIDASQSAACRIPDYGPAGPLQCALERLGGRTDPGSDPTQGPHVLWLPAGEYPVDRTLWLEGRAGVQVVGEEGRTVVRWVGPAGSGPTDARVLFHAEGNRDTTYRGLVWDGGCLDPAGCFVVAFDQSFCGRTDQAILRGGRCGAEQLGWPERPTVGQSDNGSAHFDSTYRNAWIGLRIGHHGVADDTTTHRRGRYERNLVGASLEDWNALRHWFWDSTFSGNGVGLSNNTAESSGDAAGSGGSPGLCDENDRPCRTDRDCAGVRCRRVPGWGGDFSVFRGRFRDNVRVDLWAEPTGDFVVRGAWSEGSGGFFQAGGPNATPGRFLLVGNRVGRLARPFLSARSPGPFLLAGNVIDNGAGAAGVFEALQHRDPHGVEVGSVDLISLGNRFTGAGHFDLRSPGRVVARDDVTTDAGESTGMPAIPIHRDPLAHRPIYTVIDIDAEDGVANAERIQELIELAAADPLPAVVHFPGVGGRIPVARTLRLPSGSDLVLAGDGAWTTLFWTGNPGEPLLVVDAAAVRRATLRDLQVRGAGIVIHDLDRSPAQVFMSQVRVDEFGETGIVLEGIESTRVDMADVQINGGLIAGGAGIGLLVRQADEAGPSAGIHLWSGITLRNAMDFEAIGGGEGSRLLIHNNYMERSLQHLRVRGGRGRIAIAGSKIATLPAGGVAAGGLAPAAIELLGFDGQLDLLATQLFVIPPRAGQPADDARGPRIFAGAGAAVRGVGMTFKPGAGGDPGADPEADVARGARWVRVASQAATPAGLQLADVAIAGATTAALDAESAAVEATAAVAALLEADPPGFYDEEGADGLRINLDKVFVYKAPGAGLVLAGGPTCGESTDCPADRPRCDRRDVPAGVPGYCRR